jgi:GntR family transcriptional regulator/MocR family aminotransferase
VGALQGSAPDLVAYVGTASKSLAPALGLAWLVVPPYLLDDVVRAKELADGYTGVLEQLTLQEFIRDGAYDRHVRRSRLRYRRRRDQLIAALAAGSPRTTVTGMSAGLHVVLRLHGVPASEEVAMGSRARRLGLAVHGLDRFRLVSEPDAEAALVVGYARPPDHDYAAAVEALCAVLS